MPEGDNLYRAAHTLAPRFEGETVAAVHDRGLRRAVLAGKKIEAIESRGKNLLIRFEGGISAHVHLGIRGSIRTVAASEVSDALRRRASLVIETAAHAMVVSNARTVTLGRTAFMHASPGLARLGPDLLAPEVPWPEVLARARASDASTLAELLLDQRVAAGLGNVYKSELLFLGKHSPFAHPRELDDAAVLALFQHGRELLQANVGGWSRTTTANLARGERPQRGRGRTWVYGRVNRPCYLCGTIIAATRQGDQARRTFYCARCQKVQP